MALYYPRGAVISLFPAWLGREPYSSADSSHRTHFHSATLLRATRARESEAKSIWHPRRACRIHVPMLHSEMHIAALMGIQWDVAGSRGRPGSRKPPTVPATTPTDQKRDMQHRKLTHVTG